MPFAGRFDIERELGRGAMATVYLAVDRKHGRRVALKILRPEVQWPGAAERFHREIELAARLAHPNIVPLFDSGEADGTIYFIMQYVEGAETLRDRLTRDGALPVGEVTAVTRDVASALDYAHRHGIVHRDIKPENILLAEGRALVLDFGIARALDTRRTERTTEAGLVIGTPAYMSPEQASAGEEVGPTSDLYSLGCVMYEMLGGSPPFTGTTPQKVLIKHIQEVPRPLAALRPDTPAWLQELVGHLLAKEPSARGGEAADLITRLEAPGRVPHARTGWMIAAVLGLVALAALVLLRQPRPAAAKPDPAEVAVLYLDARGDSTLRPLASGLTEALIDRLSRVEGLRVRSIDAVRTYRDSAAPIETVVQRLGVGTVVSGEVTGTTDDPTVMIRLLGPDGTQLDSRSVRASGAEAIALQDSLADQVAVFLRQRLGREITLRARQRGTRNDRAWLLLQRADEARSGARTLLERGDTVAVVRMLEFGDSLAAASAQADPKWTEPLIMRGWLITQRLELGRRGIPRDSLLAAAERQAARALMLAPGLPDALELRGVLRAMSARRVPPDTMLLASGIADLREAASPENPHQARVLSRLSRTLLDEARFEEAKLAAQQAYERDAFLEQAERVLLDLYQTSLYLEQWQDASKWCATGQERFPGNWLFRFCDLALQVMGADPVPSPARAWQVVAAMDTLAPPADRTPARWEMMAATVVARAGLDDSARRTLVRARAHGGADRGLDFYEAAARVQLGDTTEAIALLRRIIERDPADRSTLAGDPAFRPLAGHPDFEALMRR